MLGGYAPGRVLDASNLFQQPLDTLPGRAEPFIYRFGRSRKSPAGSRAVIEHLTKAWKGPRLMSQTLHFPDAVPALFTKMLYLRELTEHDVPAWFERASDPESAVLAGDPIP